MYQLPEKEVVQTVQHHFHGDPNVVVFRRNVGAVAVDGRFVRFGQAGQADFWGIIREVRCPHCEAVVARGVHLEIECKAARGRISKDQEAFLDAVRRQGGIAVVARPKPDRSDPTGFRHLKTILAAVDKESCDACRRYDIGSAAPRATGNQRKAR